MVTRCLDDAGTGEKDANHFHPMKPVAHVILLKDDAEVLFSFSLPSPISMNLSLNHYFEREREKKKL